MVSGSRESWTEGMATVAAERRLLRNKPVAFRTSLRRHVRRRLRSVISEHRPLWRRREMQWRRARGEPSAWLTQVENQHANPATDTEETDETDQWIKPAAAALFRSNPTCDAERPNQENIGPGQEQQERKRWLQAAAVQNDRVCQPHLVAALLVNARLTIGRRLQRVYAIFWRRLLAETPAQPFLPRSGWSVIRDGSECAKMQPHARRSRKPPARSPSRG
jgi:hypothetical protein